MDSLGAISFVASVCNLAHRWRNDCAINTGTRWISQHRDAGCRGLGVGGNPLTSFSPALHRAAVDAEAAARVGGRR